MNTTKEKIKNVVIVVLLLGMVYLTYAVWFFDNPFGDIGLSSIFGVKTETYSEPDESGGDSGRFGIRPLGIYIRDELGSRGAVYSGAESDEIYGKLRTCFARILGSVGETRTVSDKGWTETLKGDGVLFDYRGNVPIDVIRLWTGASEGRAAISGRLYFMSATGENVRVYIKNTASGAVYVCDSTVPSSELRGALAEISASEAYLVADGSDEDFESVNEETIVVAGRGNPPVLTAVNTIENASARNACLESFRFVNVTPSTYYEQDGTEVHIADMVTLKISPDGTVSYSDPRGFADDTLGVEIESDGEETTLAEKTEGARQFASLLASKLPGEGGIYLIEAVRTGEETEIVFGRHVNGVPVDMKGTAYFIRLVIKGNNVSAAKVNTACYDISGQSADVISDRLAAAALRGSGMRGELSLVYSDTGETNVLPVWFVGGAVKREEAK